MKPTIRSIRIAGCVGLLLLTVGLSSVEGQSTVDAIVIYSRGYADIKFSGKQQFTPLGEGTRLGVGDTIQTGTEGDVEIKLPDKSVLKIGPSSQVLIKELGTVEITKVSTSTFELIKGKIRAVVSPLLKKDSHFTIETTNATVGVRGTDFVETFDPDTESTYIIGLEDCVSLSLKRFPGSVPISICLSEELTVRGSTAPATPAAASPETINIILHEMELKGGEGTVPGERKPPFVTEVFINKTIALDWLEGTPVLTKDDLTIDGKIIIAGRAHDDIGRVKAVEVSIDGGTTFNKAMGTENWTYEFGPLENGKYEIMVRATNDAGLASDPREIGPWTILYKNVGYEDIVRTFVDTFINGIRTEDLMAVEEVVSDEYDGTLGGFYSKEEMIRDGIEDMTGRLGGTTISYTVDQVNVLGDRIVGVIHWTMMSGSIRDQGRTTWWLSRSDDFRLAHAEGDWLLRSITGEPALTLLVIDNGLGAPCDKSVKILLTAPNIPYSVSYVTVDIETYCGTGTILLDRWYYETIVGEKNGFGVEAPMELMSPSCITGSCGAGYTTYLAADPFFTCEYSDYGYSFSDTIMLP
jgi:hypothetical protein